MYIALLLLHLIICLALVAVVLVQSGKGGGLAGGAFGGSAQTVLGGRGATDFITRATMILGGMFFVTSLVLAMMSAGLGTRSRSLLQSEQRTQAPAQPGQVPGRAPATTPPAGTAPATPTPVAPGTQSPASPTPTPGSAPPSSGGN